MPTKSNNIGGQGGKRKGAGRPKKKPEPKSIDDLTIPELKGVKMPKPDEFLSSKQKGGEDLGATQIYEETYLYLKKCHCATKVSKGLLEQYSMATARWIQCEEMTSKLGFLSLHPTTGKPIPSPFINIGINYMNQSMRLWDEILEIIRENNTSFYNDEVTDPMESLLRNKK